jgi:hypothetical protein
VLRSEPAAPLRPLASLWAQGLWFSAMVTPACDDLMASWWQLHDSPLQVLKRRCVLLDKLQKNARAQAIILTLQVLLKYE